MNRFILQEILRNSLEILRNPEEILRKSYEIQRNSWEMRPRGSTFFIATLHTKSQSQWFTCAQNGTRAGGRADIAYIRGTPHRDTLELEARPSEPIPPALCARTARVSRAYRARIEYAYKSRCPPRRSNAEPVAHKRGVNSSLFFFNFFLFFF